MYIPLNYPYDHNPVVSGNYMDSDFLFFRNHKVALSSRFRVVLKKTKYEIFFLGNTETKIREAQHLSSKSKLLIRKNKNRVKKKKRGEGAGTYEITFMLYSWLVLL